MACKINITPKFGPNKGKEVESSLFNQIIELIKDPVLAKEAYYDIFSPEFIEQYGDWINDYESYKGKLDDNGEPILAEKDTNAMFPGLETPIELRNFSRESTEPTVEKAIEKPEEYSDPTPKAGPKYSNVVDNLGRKKEEEGLRLDDPSDKQYKGKNGKLYDRLTSVVKKIVGKDVDVERARVAAETVFRNLRKDTENDTIIIENKELNFEELVRHYERKFNTAAAYGRAVHKYLEYYITKDKKLLTELAYIRAAKTKEKDGIDQDVIDAKSTNWVTTSNVAELLIARSGYTSTDKMSAEVMIHSDILGIATQVDGLYTHDDNTISLVDWKSGSAFLRDKSTLQPMPYSAGKDQVNNSRLNQAKLEVTLRALIIKEQTPDAKFRDLTVHHIERNNLGKNPYKIDLEDSLDVLSNFFKDTDIDKWNQLNAKGLFDYKNYRDYQAEAGNILKKYGNLAPRDQIKALENEATLLRNKLNSNQSANIVKDQDKLGRITSEILLLKDHTKSEIDPDMIAEKESTGALKAFFGSIANISNKHIEQYGKIFQESRLKFLGDKTTEQRKADKLFKAVQDEFSKKNVLAGITEVGTLGAISGYDYRDMYSFAFKHREDESVSKPGFYRKTVEEAKAELASGDMTQAQFNLLEYLDSTWRGTWSDVMLQDAYTDRYGNNVSYSQSMGLIDDGSQRGIVNKEGALSEMFIPRLPQEYSEMGEEFSGLSRPLKGLYKMIKVFGSRQFSFFDEEEYSNYDQGQGTLNSVKVRYTGSDYSITGQKHSFNLENMHYSFMTNMYQKKHMDFALALADGLKSFYQAKETVGGTKTYGPIIEFLDKHIVQTLLQETGYRDNNLTKYKLSFQNPFYQGHPGQRKAYSINVYKALMALKNLSTGSALFLKVIGGSFNGLLIAMQTATTAVAGSVTKRVLKSQGLSTDDIDFTVSNLAKGVGDVAKLYASMINPMADKRNNKLYNLLKRFNYLPDNYDYAVDDRDLRKLKSPLLRYSNLFVFHAFHEHWGHAVLLSAQMHKLKMPDGTSMWDSYNDDGTFKEFKKDGSRNIRGIRKGRTPAEDQFIGELTAEELSRFYKASTLIHGSYRSWEKSAIEAYALGQWFLQFKKYLPAILFREWESRHEDFNLGYYKYTDENGNKNKEKVTIDGQEVELDVMEWNSAIHEGRARVLGKLLLASVGVKAFRNNADMGDYRLSSLSGRDQLGAIASGTSIIFSALMMLALSSFYEDDEEDPFARRFGYLASDGLQGFNPREVLRTVKNPVAVITHLNNSADGLGQMIMSGVTGDYTREGKLKGQNQLMKTVPFLSIQAELERYDLIGKNK